MKRNMIWQTINYIVYPGIPASFCIFFGAFISIRGFSDYQAAANFWNKAILATGTIVGTTLESRTAYSGGIPMSYEVNVPTIQFATQQGETITFRGDDDMCAAYLNSNSCNGKEVRIVYDSSNPYQVIVAGSSSPLDRVRYGIGWGMFLMLFGILLIVVPPQNN